MRLAILLYCTLCCIHGFNRAYISSLLKIKMDEMNGELIDTLLSTLNMANNEEDRQQAVDSFLSSVHPSSSLAVSDLLNQMLSTDNTFRALFQSIDECLRGQDLRQLQLDGRLIDSYARMVESYGPMTAYEDTVLRLLSLPSSPRNIFSSCLAGFVGSNSMAYTEAILFGMKHYGNEMVNFYPIRSFPGEKDGYPAVLPGGPKVTGPPSDSTDYPSDAYDNSNDYDPIEYVDDLTYFIPEPAEKINIGPELNRLKGKTIDYFFRTRPE